MIVRLLAALAFLACGTASALEPTWRLAMVGDVMLGTDTAAGKLPPHDGKGLLDEASPFFRQADVALGNLEGSLGSGGINRKVGCGKCYAFRTPIAIVPRLKEAGFTGFSIANNHARDFGDEGWQQTHNLLTQAGMGSAGFPRAPIMAVGVRQTQTCLLAFAPNSGMHSLNDVAQMQRMVKHARTRCHLVVVSFHGGAEGSDKTRTPQGHEHYLGEDRGDVRMFARSAIEAGAQVVFGHGPHVPRGMELYRGHLIAYSLGNFMTYGGISVQGVLGYAPLLRVELDAQGRLMKGQVVSFRQTPHGPVRLDSKGSVAALMQQLTQADFNGGRLQWGASGVFVPAP